MINKLSSFQLFSITKENVGIVMKTSENTTSGRRYVVLVKDRQNTIGIKEENELIIGVGTVLQRKKLIGIRIST